VPGVTTPHTAHLYLTEGAQQYGHIRRHIHSTSLSLRMLGNHDSTWKTDFLLNELDQIWMNIFELLLQFIHYNMCLSCRITIFKHPQQKEMCWRVWWRFLWHLHPHGRTRVYICIDRKSREIGTKNINSNDFFLTEIFFSKLKQFLRRCSLIVETYFETIFIFGKKLFEGCILIVNKQPRSRFRPCWRISSGGIVQFIITLKATTKTDVQLLYMTEENRY